MKPRPNPCTRHTTASLAGGRFWARLIQPAFLSLAMLLPRWANAETAAQEEFKHKVQPLLARYCSDCHADGAHKGNVDFDRLGGDPAAAGNRKTWLKVLKNLRAGLMPPQKKPRPLPDEQIVLEKWIKYGAFAIDPANPDPGRVTIRRLNRSEYRNTIRDLMGIDFDTEQEFPPDDSGHGFDNIGDVLTLSPMLIEKYLAAAKTIVEKAVPSVSRVPREHRIGGSEFARAEDGKTNAPAGRDKKEATLSYYEPGSVSNTIHTAQAGRYQLLVDVTANEKFVDGQFDYNKCRLTFSADGEELLRKDYVREGGKAFHYECERGWTAGEHQLVFQAQPIAPTTNQVRSLNLRVDAVTLRGPLDQRYWVRPRTYERFFGTEQPSNLSARREYSRKVLARFAAKAFRFPPDAPTVERLAALAESVYSQPGKTVEAGLGQAMVAVLASPRFLFREERAEAPAGEAASSKKHPSAAGPDEPAPAVSEANQENFPAVDEYALASRLSYFLWSSMPDDELFRLAEAKKLRANLGAQFKRMLADERAQGLIKNFTGQWLQARDIETVPIETRAVMQRESEPDPAVEAARKRFRELRDREPETLTAEEKDELAKARTKFFKSFGRFNRFELNGALRRDMRRETEKYFDYVVRQDRSVTELLESDYTFLNKRLAEHYGLPAVEGDELRRVTLATDSPRGGILTQGTVLAVTSNPTRTSPVKRGLFILENILGTPPPPPPANIPPLEDAAKGVKGREPTLRETLALHRDQPLCSSCHNRMDPLGLALENFNALGRWRDKERGQPVEEAGSLITGESVTNVQQLKRVLAVERREDFYRCLTEKLLTYALGRGLEYYDQETVDQLVARLRAANGRPSALLLGIVESAPFQKRRPQALVTTAAKPLTNESHL